MTYMARLTGPLQFQSLMYTAEAVQKYLRESESAEYSWSISRFDYWRFQDGSRYNVLSLYISQ